MTGNLCLWTLELPGTIPTEYYTGCDSHSERFIPVGVDDHRSTQYVVLVLVLCHKPAANAGVIESRNSECAFASSAGACGDSQVRGSLTTTAVTCGEHDETQNEYSVEDQAQQNVPLNGWNSMIIPALGTVLNTTQGPHSSGSNLSDCEFLSYFLAVF